MPLLEFVISQLLLHVFRHSDGKLEKGTYRRQTVYVDIFFSYSLFADFDYRGFKSHIYLSV